MAASHDLRDKLDGIQVVTKMDIPYPESMSRLHKGISTNIVENNFQNFKRKTKKNMDRKGRFRTQPITFMEIQEVDEDSSELAMTSAVGGLPVVRIIGGGSDEQHLPQQGNQSQCSGLSLPSNTMVKARSAMDLNQPQEDFTRMYRRPQRKQHDRPRSSPPPPLLMRDSENLRAESPLEEAETADQVCRLIAPLLLPGSGHHHHLVRSSPDIEYPPSS